jgi:hypothetical protein
MTRTLFKILIVILYSSCTGTTVKKGKDLNSKEKENVTIKVDTTIYPFTDTTYQLTVHQFNSDAKNRDKINSTVTFKHLQGKSLQKIFVDSFYCMYPDIELHDFNNDKVKDVLVFSSTGARSNPTYHFYLVDSLKHNLTYIKGFEKLPNPDFDTSKNIITSVALAGTDYIWSFYRINSKNQLINVGQGFTADMGDSVKYDKAIKDIVKERGK